MPTDKDFKALLRPLLKRRPDLAFQRRVLFFVPVTHYLRCVMFPEGAHTRTVQVTASVNQLFSGGSHLDFGNNACQQPSFYIAPNAIRDPETCEATIHRIEAEFLPLVESVRDPASHQAIPACFRGNNRGGYVRRQTKALDDCFVGDFDSAQRELALNEEEVPEYAAGQVTEEHKFHPLYHWRMAYLLRVLQTDRKRVPELLHEWEAYTVKAEKLIKYWQPTPFPCEK